jgi:hypothetical protein
VPADWTPARTRQIDRDGRWTLKRGRKRAPSDFGGLRRQATTEIVVPVFGYKNHVASTGRGFIRRSAVTHAAAHDGGQLEAPLDRDNWRAGRIPPIARKPTWRCSTGWCPSSSVPDRGQADAGAHPRCNATRAKMRATVEHVFAAQKRRLHLLIRTIGLARATTKIIAPA